MSRLLAILICAVFTFSTAYAQDAKKKKETVTFFVEGMDCANCVKKIEKNIAFEKGVTDLKCDLSTRTAAVTYRADKTSKTKLASAFKKIGMEATPVDNGAGCPVDPAKKKWGLKLSTSTPKIKMDADSDYLPEYSIFVRSQEKYFIRNAAFRIIWTS